MADSFDGLYFSPIGISRMNLDNMRHAIGMVWYFARTIGGSSKLWRMANSLPPSFDGWLGLVEMLETKFSDCGLSVIRVTIEPETFLAWRAARGLRAEAALRDLFASEYGFRQSPNA